MPRKGGDAQRFEVFRTRKDRVPSKPRVSHKTHRGVRWSLPVGAFCSEAAYYGCGPKSSGRRGGFRTPRFSPLLPTSDTRLHSPDLEVSPCRVDLEATARPCKSQRVGFSCSTQIARSKAVLRTNERRAAKCREGREVSLRATSWIFRLEIGSALEKVLKRTLE